MREREMLAERPEKIRQKTIAPLNTDGVIRAKKAVCVFDYYIKDSRGKWQPRLYLLEHRTLADIFLEAALFDPKKNVLCIPRAEWESSPEEARQSLKKFEKIFTEPYQTSQSFLRRLFRACRAGKSILLPATGDARGLDRDPFSDEKALVKLCRMLRMPVCTVTFREETPERGEKNLFFLDVKPLFSPEELKNAPAGISERAISEVFQKETENEEQRNFRERKKRMMRDFLKSELNVAIPAEICQCLSAGRPVETAFSESVLRADMTGITLETGKENYHRAPGALKSLAVYPGKKPETAQNGTMLLFPCHEKVFYLFTAQTEEAKNIQAAAEQMYEIVSEQ